MGKRKLFTVLFLVVGLAIAFYSIRYIEEITHEDSEISLVFASSLLDFSSFDYVKFDETEYVIRYVSESGVDKNYNPIKKQLSDLGWSYDRQEGSALFFHRDKETIVVETKLFSQGYLLWDMPIEALSSE